MAHILKHEGLEIFLEGTDYTDLKTIDGHVGLRPFIAGMLSYYPWWIVLLYRIREIIVRVLGLVRHEKPKLLPHIQPDALSFTPGENATFFIVKQAEEDRYWVAETPEDKHLKACFGVVVEKRDLSLNRFHVFTTITYLHWTGPVYFNLIRPFHHLVVSKMMKAGIQMTSEGHSNKEEGYERT